MNINDGLMNQHKYGRKNTPAKACISISYTAMFTAKQQ
jgi:hypothetical protein